MSEIIRKFYNEHPNFGINSLRRQKINNLIADEIQKGGKKILDIGCATGYVSSLWRVCDNYIIGIDIAEKSIFEAKKHLDEAIVVDLENYPWPAEVTKNKYDIILCAEIIEHLFKPEKLLKYLKRFLAEDGSLIITTPNFLVWSDRIKMLLGYYEVLDKGHIRLFSYKNFKKLLNDCGYKIITEDNLLKPNWLDKFAGFLPTNFFVYQIIAKIKPK
jgi:2-polyprenyl-3-methyl-5-hydroxy-6-metoxy-1,4-benzoquinol methylase